MAEGITYIQPSEAFWEIPGVVYRGEKGIYRIFSKMNPAMTQDQLVEFSEKEKQKGNPHVMDSILHFAIFSEAYKLKKVNQEETQNLRAFLRTGLRTWPNTLTRVVHNPKGREML